MKKSAFGFPIFVLFFVISSPCFGQGLQQTEGSCVLCQLPKPAQVVPVGDLCEDLSVAACENRDGSSRYKGKLAEIENSLKDLVQKARDLAVGQMGYLNFEQAIYQSLTKAGIKIRSDLSAKAKTYLLTGDYKYYVDSAEIFSDVLQCRTEATALGNYYSMNLDQLKAAKLKVLESDKKLRETLVQLYAVNLPDFFGALGRKCEDLIQAKERNPQAQISDPQTLKLDQFCKNPGPVRRSAIELYRNQDDPKSAVQAKDLVDQSVSLLNVNLDYLTAIPTGSPTPPGSSDELAQLRLWAGEFYSKSYQRCSLLSNLLDKVPRQNRDEFLVKTATARVSVEFLIDQVYSRERQQRLFPLFDQVKVEALKLARRITSDKAKIYKIQNTYQRMNMTWFVKPEDSQYKTDPKTGIQYLNLDGGEGSSSSLVNSFRDPSLSFFTSLNAFYTPDTKFGAQETDLNVTMMPLLIEMSDQNSFGFLSVLAHEVGHNLGPNVSAINAFNLRAELAPVLSCLSKPDSIRMQVEQSDESTADFVSAEILTKMIQFMPSEQRQDAVIASMEPYCHFTSSDDDKLSLMLTEAHPESILRASGIFGGNPSLRKLLGCQGSSSRYRTCGLPGIQSGQSGVQ